ncbi:integrase catalytic domain-containing protein, partial [Trichonephila clavata]
YQSRTHTAITYDPEVHHVSVQISDDRLDNQVGCLWELDSIGIRATQIKSKPVQGKEILAEFSKTYQTEKNRRVMSLPWKPTASTLPTNMANQEKSSDTLQKRLTSNDVWKKIYEKGMLNYIEQEHIEVWQLETSNENKIYYLPHRAVKKAKLN